MTILCAALALIILALLIVRKPRVIVAAERDIADAAAHVERFATAVEQAVDRERKKALKAELAKWRAILTAERM